MEHATEKGVIMINIIKETDEQLEKGPWFLISAEIKKTLVEIDRCFPEIKHIDEITLKRLKEKAKAGKLTVEFCSRDEALPDYWDSSGTVATPNFYFWAE